MAASRRVSPAAARPPGAGAPRARGRRRRPSLWRRLLLALPRPTPTLYVDPAAALQDEVHELRLAVAALRAEVTRLHERLPAEPEPVIDLRGPAAVTLVLPLARAAALAGVPADGVVNLDISADTAPAEIVLTPAVFPAAIRKAAPAAAMAEVPAAAMAEVPAEVPTAAVAAHESVAPRVSMLPEAPLLDPRLARVAEALDDLLGDDAAVPAEQPVGAGQRETA